MNYGEVKSHFEALLNRSDNTSALTTTFIDQGIRRLTRLLRSAMNEKVQVITLSAQTASITLPSDFIEFISLYYKDRELIRLPNSQFRPYAENPVQGRPNHFTRQQETVFIHPQPSDGEMTLYYYGDFDALSGDSDSNALTVTAPDLLIYAALTYAADYYLDERATIFEQKFQAFLTEIQSQADDQELNGSTQQIAPAYRYEDNL
ncbi:MAG: phage adaptor protein [Psychrobacter sp.]